MGNANKKVRRCALALFVAGAALAGPARGLDPATPLRDYNHTTWTERDGAPQQIHDMAQTADGWIWIAASDGLYRFDGTHFEAVTPRPQEGWREHVGNLYAAPNGDLWINYAETPRISVLHPDGSLTDVPIFSWGFDTTFMFAQAPDGAIWAPSTNGLHCYRNGREVSAGALPGLPKGTAYSIAFEPDGKMWVAHEGGVFVRAAGADRFERVANVSGPSSLIRSPDGAIWLAAPGTDGVERLASGTLMNNKGAIDSNGVALFDRGGNLWSTSCKRLCVMRSAQAQALLHPAALAAKEQAEALPALPTANLVLEDSAGSIWVATPTTLERFRDVRLHPSPLPLAPGGSMALDDDGQVWMVDRPTATAWRMGVGGAIADRSQPFQLVTDDIDNRMLLAGRREIERRWRGRVEKIPLPPTPDGKHVDLDVLGVQDDGKIIWVYTLQTALIGYADGRWRPRSAFNLPDKIMLTTPGGNGRYWLACADSSVVLYDNGKLTRYDASVAGGATVMHLSEHLVVAGHSGIAVLKDGRMVGLTTADPAVLREVTGIAVDGAGDRWLNGAKGVVHVRAADWRASVANPALPLNIELFGAADGYRGRPNIVNRLPSLMVGRDGRLWVGTTEGVFYMDTQAAHKPAAPPRIIITAFGRGGAEQATHDGARLRVGPAPHAVSITYAAPGMGRPEAVRFAYRLADENEDWQEVGARRTAFYTSLSPGRHRFEVRAANQDGVWSPTPAVLELDVAPTVTQTIWFRLLLGILALGALWLVYRWRLRLVSAQILARFHERLDERNRIARELHDTLLQAVHALQLKVHGAAMRLPPEEPVKPLLEAALRQAELTIHEGRARVRDLRGDEADALSLSEMLAAVGRELGQRAGAAASEAGARPEPAFTLRTHGTPRPLRSEVRQELFAIGRESLINVFRHARAAHVDVQIHFGKRACSLTVADDGAGIPAGVLEEGGRTGHWGIRGMRERAKAIGAQLQIGGASGGGTSITVSLPASLAYTYQSNSFLAWRRRA